MTRSGASITAVYGGAIHPTAEGHAAMADAALPAVREVLGLSAAAVPVSREPLPRSRRMRRIRSAAHRSHRARAAAQLMLDAGVRSSGSASAHATPSFFCRLVDDVVYWNVSFLSG